MRLAGVYFLLLNEELVYIGQSGDIPARIAGHLAQRDKPVTRVGWPQKGDKPNRYCKEFDRALWIEVPLVDLNAYEGAFIRALAPPLNFSAPTDVGRDVEILNTFGLSLNDDALRQFEARRHARFSKPRRSVRRGPRKAVATRNTRSAQKVRAKRLWSAVESMLSERMRAAA